MRCEGEYTGYFSKVEKIFEIVCLLSPLQVKRRIWIIIHAIMCMEISHRAFFPTLENGFKEESMRMHLLLNYSVIGVLPITGKQIFVHKTDIDCRNRRVRAGVDMV